MGETQTAEFEIDEFDSEDPPGVDSRAWSVYEEGDQGHCVRLYDDSEWECDCLEMMHKPGLCRHVRAIEQLVIEEEAE